MPISGAHTGSCSESLLVCINRFGSPGQLYLVDSLIPCRNYQTKIKTARLQKNPPSNDKDVRYIPLTQGKFTIVDAEGYDRFSKYKWHCRRSKNKFYAYRTERKTRKTIGMHREIIGAPPGLLVDHIDGNGLNNRKSNLRLCTYSQNTYNRRPNRNSISKYKGVTYHKRNKKWEAKIIFNGKFIYLGGFDDEKEAALAYDRKAGELFGEFAYLNFKKSE